MQRPGAGRIRDSEGFVIQLYHLLHLIHGPLQLMNMLTDIAQITVNDKVGSENVRDLAGCGTALPPQPQCRCRDGRAERPKQCKLASAVPGVPHPGCPRPAGPLLYDAAQTRILPRFRAE